MSAENLFRVCIWMNIPSHYQSAFFHALDKRGDVDLRVVYFQGISQGRAAEGWSDEHVYMPFESSAEGCSQPVEMVRSLPDWEERIHIIGSNFNTDLIDWFCEK